MTKKELIKEWFENKENINFIHREADLYLENNYGCTCQYLYSLVNTEKKELEEYYKTITRQEAIKIKNYICLAYMEAIKFGLNYDGIEANEATIKKAMKENNIFNSLTTYFINNLNGGSENIEIIKKVFKKYYNN